MTSNTGFSDAAGQRIIDLDEVLFRGARTVSQLPKRCIDVDLAALIYTSGSTGRPKAVAMTHLNLVSAMSSIVEYLEITTADILLSVLPLSFSYGLGQVLSAFKAGATVILERSATYPHILLETIAREGVTGLPLVPTLATILLQLNLSKYDLSSLRYITSASAVFPSIHIAKFRRLLPGVRIYSMYGLTECCRVSFLPPDQIDIRPDSVGKGMPNQEAYIVGDDGARVRPGDIGELVVRGSSVMGGYWNDPQETEKRLKVGPNPWDRVLYTGDLFRADSEGFLYFVARKDDIIKTRGEKVSPREIEEVLYRLDDIAQAVIVGIPDPILGTAIKAVVTLRPGADLTKRQIKHHCAKHLDRCRIPSQIEIREELPKSENGKVNRKTLLFPCSA
jgi:acyl-CoA synthetase (AMP-forming)/AMP-acid ligase II